MAYSRAAQTWAKRAKPLECSCGCGVIIMPKPAWYKARHSPPKVRFIRGHEPKADETPAFTTPAQNERPTDLIVAHEPKADETPAFTTPAQNERPTDLIVANKTPEAVIVTCPRPGCGTRWQTSPEAAERILEEGCVAYCQIDDIIEYRIANGLPVYPDDDLDEAEGAVTMSVRAYNELKTLKSISPSLQKDVPAAAMTLGTLAHQIKTGTFRGTAQTESEVRDILDQIGLSEEYI